MNNVFLNIIKNGKYYCPAWTHYDKQTSVVCDRCGSTQLVVCIGWDKYDMCLKCVDTITSHQKPEIISSKKDTIYPISKMNQDKFIKSKDKISTVAITNREQNIFKNKNVTRMMQDIYNKYDKDTTFMMQDIYEDTYYNNRGGNNKPPKYELNTYMMQDMY